MLKIWENNLMLKADFRYRVVRMILLVPRIFYQILAINIFSEILTCKNFQGKPENGFTWCQEIHYSCSWSSKNQVAAFFIIKGVLILNTWKLELLLMGLTREKKYLEHEKYIGTLFMISLTLILFIWPEFHEKCQSVKKFFNLSGNFLFC